MKYQYKCIDCKNNFEIIKKIEEYNSDIVSICPFCFSCNVKRIYLDVPVIYKTNGFYKTGDTK
jgi:putative FmdB family regulatory protein